METSMFLGYTCVCGESVRVFEVKRGEDNHLPQMVTVACSNGHPATFNAKQVGLLELLSEEAGEVSTFSGSRSEGEREEAA